MNIFLLFLENPELSLTPIPESINDEDQIDSSKSQVKTKNYHMFLSI